MSIRNPLACEKKRKRWAVRGGRTVAGRRGVGAAEEKLHREDVFKVCKVDLVLLLERLGGSRVCFVMMAK